MDRKQLEEICNITDLRKYEDTAEYQNIIEGCKNKAETIESQILSYYENGDRLLTLDAYDFHDRSWAMVKFYENILSKIKSKTKGALALRMELEEGIKEIKKGITGSPVDKFLNVYSQIKLTELDLLRSEKSFNENFHTNLTSLINTIDPPKIPEPESIY